MERSNEEYKHEVWEIGDQQDKGPDSGVGHLLTFTSNGGEDDAQVNTKVNPGVKNMRSSSAPGKINQENAHPQLEQDESIRNSLVGG